MNIKNIPVTGISVTAVDSVATDALMMPVGAIKGGSALAITTAVSMVVETTNSSRADVLADTANWTAIPESPISASVTLSLTGSVNGIRGLSTGGNSELEITPEK